MIKHIVLFQLADNAEGKSKHENAAFIKTALEKLKGIIPELKEIEVGINHIDTASSNYDVALYSAFDSLEDLNKYNIHPEHQKVVQFIGKVKVGRVAVDYEI